MIKDNRKSCNSREARAKLILLIFDMFGIFLSLFLGFLFVNVLNNTLSFSSHTFLNPSYDLYILYLVIPFIFFQEGIYSHRFDFWHEFRLVVKSLFLSFVIIFAYLALAKETGSYSRSVIIVSFIFMVILIPLMKIFIKRWMFKIGLWKLGVKILCDNIAIESNFFNNPYLGYIKSNREESTISFLNSHKNDVESIKKRLEEEISSNNKVMFLPVFDNYQFSSSDIFELNNRTSLVVLQNKLNSSSRMFINISYNYIVAILLLPLLLPIIGIISLLIKLDSNGPVFFMQERLGVDGKIFMVFKFRTMHINGHKILDKYLKDNPKEKENYKVYCKYENDPRITKIGKILRNTSADELAQIFNVLKGEMNFVGPRPYMVTEKEKIGQKNSRIILKVKPGITGLWQVSGRNDLTFEERITMDRWYIYNWSLWMDFVIFLKTISVVLNKSGAK